MGEDAPPLVVILPAHLEPVFRWWLDEHGLEMVQVRVGDGLEWLVRRPQ
jgi:hypothetical protein